ncbi:TonB-dependent receptor domain-containing protein [Undibacterium baiyunense]|uniref:TonB-dependent receptor n=1 Tax=Undibacterium baiyunense TaxID=2828731 RepID=A0A941DBU2_9BURK|nr:TonB-dependent receptor [Undibacterium baiyunense]MBR7745814.1 TonB-dependent receptor [Undibacterium baiyunense]
MIEKILSRSMRLMFTGGVVASMGAMALPAMAQDKKVETVVVTGTRITSPGTTSNSPIGSITAEEIKSSQPVAVEEFFKGLPAAVPAIGPGTNNGSGGAATIDLRGLGSNRTLVLVNGRRIVPYDLGGTVDTNSIPVALLSRVDLVTGGASVVYGADAVSGVANFNLKKNFQGFEVNSSYGSTSKGDAQRYRTDVTMGASLDEGRGNVVLSLGRTKSDPLTQGTRSYGLSALNSVTGAPDGSGTTVPAAMSTTKGTGGTDALAGTWQIDPATGKLVQPVSLYNFNPLNYYVTGLDRSQATSLANYKINDNFEVYGEMFYTASKVASTLAESGTFNNTFNVPIGNPFIPAAAREQLCQRRGIAAADCVVGNSTIVPLTIGRRITELGPRFNDFDNKTLQYTLGSKGEIAGSWSYDAYWSRGTADQTQIRKNWGSLSKVKQALNSVAAGKCVDASNGCVPLNVWGAAGSITPEQANFINQSAILMQGVEQDVAAVSTTGDLGNIRSPWAKQPIQVAVSTEQRKVTAYTKSDAASQLQGEVLGTGAPTPDRTGTFKLKEYAVEALVPLLKDLPFARALNLELGYRQTNFETAKNSQDYGSYKYGGEWAPVKSIRFRGMVQLATRAPNVNEMFAPQTTGLSNLATDPCQLNLINAAEANTAGTLSNLCRLTGVPASVIGSLDKPSAGQINRQTGGNPNLGPEEAKTKTIGFVIEPLPKLAISLDYYKIDITKAISSPTTTDVLDGCYSTKFNPSLTLNASCALVLRSTANGSFNGTDSKGVVTTTSNLGTQSTAGYDLSVKYQMPMTVLGLEAKHGRLDFGFDLNKTTSFHAQPTPASIDRDCLGYYSVACGDKIVYKNKFNQRTAWTVGEFVFGYNWRYVSGLTEEPGGTNFLPAYAKIDAYSYLDLSAVWNFNKNIRLNLSINNATNKLPPVVGSTIGSTGTNSGNTFPQYYDAVGRYFSVGATIKF